jgi:superfamily II DNA helicase RecQ
VVVYCGFKAAADALAAQLTRSGVDAAAYHAGKNLAQREAVQVRSG